MRRLGHIFLAVFWFVWTAIIIPGHTRGAIPIAGTMHGDECCPMCGQTQDHSQHHGQKNPPTNCAICQFAAFLMHAQSFVVHLEPAELVEFIEVPLGERPCLVHHFLDVFERGPPCLF